MDLGIPSNQARSVLWALIEGPPKRRSSISRCFRPPAEVSTYL